MQGALKPGGLLLVGEPFWHQAPPDAALAAMETAEGEYTSLGGTLDRIESVGLTLVEMVLADLDSWDRYAASQWLTVDNWLRANPDDPEADDLRAWDARWKRVYMDYQREYLGWGVFVTRMK